MAELGKFALVGGTCLALRFGHRKSIDLELSNPFPFSNDDLLQKLHFAFPSFMTNSAINALGVFGYINNIKVDFVKHNNFQLIKPIVVVDGIRMFSNEGVCHFTKRTKKDFWDIAELLKHYTIEQFITAYEQKYPNNQMLISLNYAIAYFDDANEIEDPVSLNGQTWEGVKEIIRKAVRDYLS